MDYAEFKKLCSDPKYTFGFNNFYKSMHMALGKFVFWSYMSFQALLGISGIVGIAFLSYQYGVGNLIWMLPALWSLAVGKISLNLFDVVYLIIIFMAFELLSTLIQKWAGVKFPPIFGSFFFVSFYIYTGVSKYIIMSWMIRRLRNDPIRFAVLNDYDLIFPWRVG